MTLQTEKATELCIAVFPYLKTRTPVPLGSFTFRSTEDLAGLPVDQISQVREVAAMLFLKDDLRIQSSSFAFCQAFDFTSADPLLEELYNIQTIVAYAYGGPQPAPSAGPFFAFEQASLVIFKPDLVPMSIVRPEHNVQPISPPDETLSPDQFGRVNGYYGLYNFRHHFWVATGSRVYPLVPQPGLNIAQDLFHDLAECFRTPQHHILPQLLMEQAGNETTNRVLTSLAWYNRANSAMGDEQTAIVHLAIAFEALLGLPRDTKTDRFMDAVALLLGRIDRLSLWAAQFYAARSDVAHEGKTTRFHFSPTAKWASSDGPQYGSLLDYGRQIFRLCVGTLLFGAQLGERTTLKDKLISNQERFEFIVKTLDDGSRTIAARFEAVSDAVLLADRFRYVGEAGLLVKTLTASAQLAAKNLLMVDDALDPVLKSGLELLANASRSEDCFDQLAGIQAIHDATAAGPLYPESPVVVTRRLVEVVWHYTFMQYFRLKQRRESGSGGGTKVGGV
jgi:hypothetical protein